MAEGSVQMAIDNLALTGKSLPEQKAELRQRYKAQLKVVTESAKKEQAAERKANPVKAKAKGKKGKAAEVAEAKVAEVAENAIGWGVNGHADMVSPAQKVAEEAAQEAEGVYEGQWENGEMHGQGKFTWPDGVVYEGQYQNGQIHGQGKFTFSDGAVYEGQFENDDAHGEGLRTIGDKTWKRKYDHGKLVSEE